MPFNSKKKMILAIVSLAFAVGSVNLVLTTNSYKREEAKEDIGTVAAMIAQSADSALSMCELYSDLLYKYENYDEDRIQNEIKKLKEKIDSKGLIDDLKAERTNYDLTVSRIGQTVPNGMRDNYEVIQEVMDTYRSLVDYASMAPRDGNRLAYINGYQELQRKLKNSLNVINASITIK